MSDRQRVVIDTSTLIGAILRPDSVPRQALLTALGSYELAACVATLHELREVLQQPKFERYMPLQARLDFLALVSRHAHLVEVDAASEQAASGACRDVNDAKFLARALACHAVALITSDADLLVLHPWHGVPILTPAAFLQPMGE
ncbi:MAG: putative toxin-antitoxin system toxin component, PIN family [Metallibacterium scheffleri]|uniref:putative toxin-antitoxin system toxin component, PIN family n=1 Tax=Metallibacterium scheffleri TaxID=993689 RepID=UPI0026E992DC|nr:putative toxin-antitoxin system toxin component, PIN family [Metallibacterium scheffleri]MCK9365957.1 putative toxin-antitoxin system toxin component, PIN family [Metallibacterium scheffleri]